MGKICLGIDTSCYTSSLAVMTEDKHRHYKIPLKVKEGQCGLRQSDAVFEHIKNLPVLFEEMSKEFDLTEYSEKVISVSVSPRNEKGSYMPVFMAGHSFARAVSASVGAKLNCVSHQEGHIMAAIYSCGVYSILEKPFIAVHISGGTTEIVIAKRCGNGFESEIVGGTKDLPAGQFIDRIGVLMGMEFPSGKYLDTMAMEYDKDEKVKIAVDGCYINFSGEETRYRRLFENGESKERIAYCTMKVIRESVVLAIENAKREYGIENVLMAGGVSSSGFIRQGFENIPNIYFAEVELSADNAVGVCKLGEFL
ncbi:MAG: hypothetical protein E7415_02655 [Ruminococcaceae bacterium]|nr:hypothetical protein [Oscillospiraceae bacterium]